jgi:hypothetical protein
MEPKVRDDAIDRAYSGVSIHQLNNSMFRDILHGFSLSGAGIIR